METFSFYIHTIRTVKNGPVASRQNIVFDKRRNSVTSTLRTWSVYVNIAIKCRVRYFDATLPVRDVTSTYLIVWIDLNTTRRRKFIWKRMYVCVKLRATILFLQIIVRLDVSNVTDKQSRTYLELQRTRLRLIAF